MAATIELDKNHILQAILKILEKGLSTEGVIIVLSHNWHYLPGDVVDTDVREEMGFVLGPKANELILNLPAVEDLRKGIVDMDELKSSSYQWQLAHNYKDIQIIWQ